MMGKVILIASGKGGTGKTVFTANVGAVLAQRGHKVALIDLDMGLRNLDICLGLENRVVYDVADVLSGLCRIKQALIRDKRFDSLYFMASPPSGKIADITPLHIKVLCKKLLRNFEYILIDAPAGAGENVLTSAAGADIAVIVTVPEYAAVRNADALARALKESGVGSVKYVLNQVRGDLMKTGVMPGLNDISRKLKSDIAGIILHDDNIQLSANAGYPIVCKRGTYIAKNFNKIADKIIG